MPIGDNDKVKKTETVAVEGIVCFNLLWISVVKVSNKEMIALTRLKFETTSIKLSKAIKKIAYCQGFLPITNPSASRTRSTASSIVSRPNRFIIQS